MCFNEIKVK